MPFWHEDWTQQMRVPGPHGPWRQTETLDERDLRDPDVLGHRLLRLRNSEELKKKYPLSQVYDFFWS